MYMRIIALQVFLLFSFSSFIYSQTAPDSTFFYSKKAQKLAARLTVNLNTEEEKVLAIHEWITHHIKYDVKKFSEYDFKRLSVDEILKMKKAVCVGYCDLFSALCRYSNIDCVNVPGYIKNSYSDLHDKFYLDEHMWNAVKIDGSWKLIDACWDAGSVQNLRRTFKGFFLYCSTLGKRTEYKFKPHFVKRPGKFYYLRSGNFFMADHLPVNPLWQLKNPSCSISDFENDSTFFLEKHDVSPDTFFIDNNANEKVSYSYSTESKKLNMDGFAGHAFNKRNNFMIGNCFLDAANVSFLIAQKSITDSLANSINYSMILNQIDSALFYFSCNDSLLKIQEQELLDNNIYKKDFFSNYNKKMISSTQRIIHVTESSKSLTKKNVKAYKTNVDVNNKRYERIIKEKSISDVNRSNRNVIDTINYSSLIQFKVDSVKWLADTLSSYYDFLDALYKSSDVTLSKSVQNREATINNALMAFQSRIEFNDDLDYPLIDGRNNFIHEKLFGDSTLFFSEVYLFNFLSNEHHFAKMMLDQLYSFGRNKLSELKKLKSSSGNIDGLDDKYIDIQNLVINSMNEYNIRELGWIDQAKSLSILSKSIYKKAKKELAIYQDEKNIEEMNSAARLSYIKKHAAAYLKLNRYSVSSARTLNEKIERR
jgi:hypothetical protein